MKRDRSEIVPRETLESMSTAVLQELLEHELDVDRPADVNIALLKEITTILNARTGKSKIDVDEKYDTLISEHLNCEMLYPADECTAGEETVSPKPLVRKKRLGRILLVAAALVVLLVGTVQASGLDLWKAFAQWTAETFEFNVSGDVPMHSTNKSEQLAELNHLLIEQGCSVPIVPNYLPSGYTLESIDEVQRECCAVFMNGDKALVIQIHMTETGNASRMEKNDTEPESYVVNGIEHHIVSNLELYSATWVNEEYECTIYGIPSIEDAYMIIDSIYWED